MDQGFARAAQARHIPSAARPGSRRRPGRWPPAKERCGGTLLGAQKKYRVPSKEIIGILQKEL